jgi:hypothetical protein
VSIETEFPEREARHRALCGGQRERLLAGSLAPSRPCGSDAMVDLPFYCACLEDPGATGFVPITRAHHSAGTKPIHLIRGARPIIFNNLQECAATFRNIQFPQAPSRL